MILFDHNTPEWRAYPNLVTGAITYSEDIVKHQLHHWKDFLGENDVLSTAPPLDKITLPKRANRVFLYLHTWPLENTLDSFRQRNGHIDAEQVIFISAYWPYCQLLREAGYTCVYIPMSIDVESVRAHRRPKTNEGKFLYFGNVTTVKRDTFRKIREACDELQITLDVLSWNRLNGKAVVPSEALGIASTYHYGIGVGRAALELFALDVKQVIAGRSVGGLITNDEEYELQKQVNMNGRIYTYSDNIKTCLLDIDRSVIRTHEITNHVEEVIRQLA